MNERREVNKKPRKGTFRLDAAKVSSLMVARGFKQEELADKALISRTRLSQLLNGKAAFVSTIRKLAKALKVEDIATIIESEESTPPSVGIQVVDDLSFLETLASKSAGAEAVVSAILRLAEEKRPLIIVISPAVFSLLLFCTGMAPIDARGCYVAGIGLAVVGLILAHPRKGLIALAILGLTLNLAAYGLWPRAIGFFPAKSGYRFGVANRRPGRLSAQPTRYSFPLAIKPGPRINERVELRIDDKRSAYVYDGSMKITSLELEPGSHSVGVALGDQPIVKTVSVDLNGRISGDLTFDLPGQVSGDPAVTFVKAWLVGSGEILDPKGITLEIDGRPVVLEDETTVFGAPSLFETTVGWHEARLLAPGRKAATLRFYANPRAPERQEDRNEGGFNRLSNLVNFAVKTPN